MEDKVLLINFEDELINEERGLRKPISSIPTFLNTPNNESKLLLYSSNFAWIAQKMQERKSAISEIFLNIHLSYYKNSEYYPPFVQLFFKEILMRFPNSKIRIITLIDDIFVIRQKIAERETSYGYTNTKLTLREILAWRSLEFLNGEALKEHIKISEEGSRRASHLMLSIRHPHETFANLIFNKSKFWIYLSYPISESRKTRDGIEEINKFRKSMHLFATTKNVVIYDPVAIDELAMTVALGKIQDKNGIEILSLKESDRWPIDIVNADAQNIKWPIQIPIDEVEQATDAIRHQIKSRDYVLVDTATCLAVYRPYFKGELSRGVDAEIKRANESSSEVVIYHPKEDQINDEATTHPFENISSIFHDKNAFFEHLRKIDR